MGCHRDIVNSYTHSNHYKTSSAVNPRDLKKRTDSLKGRVCFTDTGCVRMEEKDGAAFQSYWVNDRETVSEKFDIAFGSAEKAQTYGYWKENKLYQLPLSWFTSIHSWANSPGFPIGRAHFGRVIESRCFECHASYIGRELVPSGALTVSENLDSNSIVYGINCERCHGPALNHVTFQQENPAAKEGRYITSIKSLSRQQQLDVCAMCHSGNDQETQRTLFAFVPGDTLSHFYYPDFGLSKPLPDVHGKQMQLLRSSRCFRESQLTCTTCHDSHRQEGNAMAGFIAKCMGCHQNSAHAAGMMKAGEPADSSQAGNCISCHMPLQSSKTILFNNGAESKNIPYFIRTHRIAIYK
jgi:hypothetical protein